VEPWHRDDHSPEPPSYIVATGADKRLNLFNLDASGSVAASISGLSDSPMLSHVGIRGGMYQLVTGMSGQLLLIKHDEVLDRRSDHAKYAVKVVAYEDENDCVWIATAGWDAKVLIYRMNITSSSSSSSSSMNIGEPVGTIKLVTNPESLLIVRNPESTQLMLLVTRRDSTFIYYYSLEALRSVSTATACVEAGKQNLAPQSNAWIAFSPSCLALSPHDPTVVAVALSTLPHMKVMIVRLLFPSTNEDYNTSTTRTSFTQAATTAAAIADNVTGGDGAAPETHITQALAALALQNREDAAIVIQANTFAPQTAYSTPQVVWRPDGSGVWVNGDDGVIRGIEAKTGKVIASLKDGHEVGSKVRSIWAGWVGGKGSTKEEWVVSGGFDKRLVIWRAS
jgi:WD40 repeat protein